LNESESPPFTGLKAVAFPASLVVIAEGTFEGCGVDLLPTRKGNEAFTQCPLESVFLPASVTEIDPNAFCPEPWKIVTFEGPPLLLMSGNFLCSLDSMTMLKCLSHGGRIEIPGKYAFRGCFLRTVIFANGSRLNEIGKEALCGW
jgi:hypothetical protein